VHPSRAELKAAYGATVASLVAPGLRVLLVGINPSLWSGAVGLHFRRPANRLWLTLREAGFTSRVLAPADTADLLAAGIGITNLVARADEIGPAELRAGVPRLTALVERWQPGWVAFLGLTA
jgi:double-stranded uracil-DNA glycosylase